MRPTLPPMLSKPRAVPLSPGANQLETNLTLGTKIPAPRMPARNLDAMACHISVDSPNNMVEEAMPTMLKVMVRLLPNLSAR